MIKDLTFKAQALDNLSADLYMAGRVLVSNDDLKSRESITSTISEISRRGKIIIADDGVEVMSYGSKFLVQVYGEQRDTAGRMVPIVVCGVGDPVRDRTVIAGELAEFARSIERTLQPSAVQRYVVAPGEGEGRLPSRSYKRFVAVAIPAAVLVAVLFAIFLKSFAVG